MKSASERVDALLDVDWQLEPSEREWRDRARDVAAQTVRPFIDDDFEQRRFPAQVIPAMAEAGLFGMHLQAPGCAGASARAYGLVCAEIEAADSGARTLLSVQGSLAMTAINRYGSDEQRHSWLPEMAAGQTLGCFALTEPQGGSDPGAMETVAVRTDSGWVIDGRKRWIGLANLADIAVVWARTDDGIRGFLVPTDTDGFVATPIVDKHAMRASVQCDISLTDVCVPDSAALPGARSLAAPLSCLNEARFGISWGVMGIVRECLTISLDFAAARTSFGASLAHKQLVQDRIAQMMVAYQNGMLTALHLARLKTAGRATPAQVSVAKLNNVRIAIAVASSARELLAADGITSQYPVMRHMANLEAVRTYEGTDDIHAMSIGRELTGVSAF